MPGMQEDAFAREFADALSCLQTFIADGDAQATLRVLATKLCETFQSGGKVMSAGNGGSFTDALHFAEEWTGRFRNSRRPYPALALGDTSHMTCVGNDYGFDEIFSRMVESFAKPGDMLILLSTSGNSENLVRAAYAGRAAGCTVVGFLGRGGGRMLPLCDHVVMAPGRGSDRIQEIHMMALHALIEETEILLGH